jgi:hypothetical protein
LPNSKGLKAQGAGRKEKVDLPLVMRISCLMIDAQLSKRNSAMKSCAKCRFRAIYDKKPRSILGRIWKWHIGWCPGWKLYLKSLSDEEREKLLKLYSH